MINRNLIRIKVVQLLFAAQSDNKKALGIAQKELDKSLSETYDLYCWLLQLSIDITEYAVKRIENGLNKLRPTAEEQNPNKRFINNKFYKQLVQNKELATLVNDKNINWNEYSELVKNLFEKIAASDIYKEYMNAESTDYTQDKYVWRRIYKKILGENNSLYNQLEDLKLYWNDDAETVFSFIEKTIKKFDQENGANQQLLPEYNNDDDKDFADLLFEKALKNKTEYLDLIKTAAKNWEIERIATMDMAIMQAALAEITSFPTIPISVSLNEYIEISKVYSTEKSSTFINGILDSIATQLKNEGKLIKVGVFVDDK